MVVPAGLVVAAAVLVMVVVVIVVGFGTKMWW
jgi:hypothetical protein